MHSSKLSRAKIWWLAAAALSAGLVLLSRAAAQDSPHALPLRILVVNSRDEAQRILDRLKGGADFAVLARLKSVDPTVEDGGWMGEVDPSTLREELRAALRGLQPGQISPLVELPSGFAILKVVAKSELDAMEAAQRTLQQANAAALAVHYSFDLSGLPQVEKAWGDLAKPPGWDRK